MKTALLVLGLFVATVTVSALNLGAGLVFAGLTVSTFAATAPSDSENA
jgi:hypothetical protein